MQASDDRKETMKTSIKIGGFVLGLTATFFAALGVGSAIGPAPAPGTRTAGHEGGHTGDNQSPATSDNTARVPGGLQVAQDGYRLIPVTPRLSTGAPTAFTFRVAGPDGTPLTAYTPTHDKELHLIVVNRDLSGFQHLHPERAGDGTWSTPLAVGTAGQYRIFADFQPAARTEPLTLGVDLPAAGTYEPRSLPAPTRTATVDGYTVTLAGDLMPGADSKLTLTVSRDGKPVTDLQPYLAAYGHLVALRDGDLAYLHVHPDGAPGDGRTAAGPDITFHTEVPSAGAYRLFLDFQHGDVVRTAEFTMVAGGTAAPGDPNPAEPTTGSSPPGQPTTPRASDAPHTDHTHG